MAESYYYTYKGLHAAFINVGVFVAIFSDAQIKLKRTFASSSEAKLFVKF